MRNVVSVFILAVFATMGYASITNLNQVVNVPLNRTVLDEIQSRDFSSPERAYLSFVKACITSNAKDMVAGFKDSEILRMTGDSNPDLMSVEKQAMMSSVLGASSVSNSVVLSYVVTTNTCVKIEAEIQTKFGGVVETNSYPIGFVKIGNKWKIEKFLEDYDNESPGI